MISKCHIIFSIVIILVLSLLVCKNPISSDNNEINVLSISPSGGSVIQSSDTLRATIEIKLAEMDTSQGQRYRLQFAYRKTKDTYSTDIINGSYRVNNTLDTIMLVYPFKVNYQENTSGTLEYSLQLNKGTSLLSPDRNLSNQTILFKK